MTSPSDLPADPQQETDEPVRVGQVYRLLFKFLLFMVPGFVAADMWVGWRDSANREADEDGYWLPDDRLGWRPRPHFENPEFETVLTDLGMRNPPIPADAPPAEVRILGCGASRTYGAGGANQPNIWNNRLQRKLDEERPGEFRVLNGGVMAYSLVQSCRRSLELIDAVQPDLVFVEATPGAQMLLDPSKARRFVYVGDQLVEKDVIDGWPEALHGAVVAGHRLLLNSNLYVRHRAKFSLENEDRPLEIQKWVLSDSGDREVIDEMIARTYVEMSKLADVCRERGIELRMMVYPEPYQDSEQQWEAFLVRNQASGAPPMGTPRLQGVELLAAECERLGIGTWDFTDEITEFGANRGRYLNDQGHWSDDGHAIVADGLYAHLRDEGLLDSLVTARSKNPR